MKKVKIIKTTYGHHNNGRIEPKNNKDEPFMLDDAEADRLVNEGIAEIVFEPVATAAVCDKAFEKGDDTTTNKSLPESDFCVPPAYNENSSVSELRAIAKEFGVALPLRATKKSIVDILDSHFQSKYTALEAEDIVI